VNHRIYSWFYRVKIIIVLRNYDIASLSFHRNDVISNNIGNEIKHGAQKEHY